MTEDLLTRLSAALEFDKQAVLDAIVPAHSWDAECFFQGARWQSERLRPIHKALIEIVRAVHNCQPGCGYKGVEALEAALREGEC